MSDQDQLQIQTNKPLKAEIPTQHNISHLLDKQTPPPPSRTKPEDTTVENATHTTNMTDKALGSATPFTADIPTLLSLGAALSLLPLAQVLSTLLVPRAHRCNRLLFTWHAFDALTHLLVEGSFLYNCFFSYAVVPDGVTLRSRPGPHFLGRADRLYGAAYGGGSGSGVGSATARLWQEYGKADARWLGADLGVVSLELLTVFLGGPVAAYICYLLYKASSTTTNAAAGRTSAGHYTARVWVLAMGLAVAELYGGWMTFAPEWLSGSTALATGDPVYLWVYLVFFNALWVVVPIGVLFAGWREVTRAFEGAATAVPQEKRGGGKKTQ